MKRFVFVAVLLIWSWSAADAQSVQGNFGIRLEGVPTGLYVSVAYPALGVQMGLEAHWNTLAFGGRVSLSSFIFLAWHAEIDLYGAYRFVDGTTLYGGLGWGTSVIAFFREPVQDWHALLGIRFASGFFLEATPGIAFGTICTYAEDSVVACSTPQVLVIGLALGWAWTLP
jgi:hypothetical protein